MNVPHRTGILARTFYLGLLLAPLFSIMLALIGLGLYSITGDQETALWICGVAVGTSFLLMPIAYWFFLPTSSEQKTTRGGYPLAKQSAHIGGPSQR